MIFTVLSFLRLIFHDKGMSVRLYAIDENIYTVFEILMVYKDGC